MNCYLPKFDCNQSDVHLRIESSQFHTLESLEPLNWLLSLSNKDDISPKPHPQWDRPIPPCKVIFNGCKWAPQSSTSPSVSPSIYIYLILPKRVQIADWRKPSVINPNHGNPPPHESALTPNSHSSTILSTQMDWLWKIIEQKEEKKKKKTQTWWLQSGRGEEEGRRWKRSDQEVGPTQRYPPPISVHHSPFRDRDRELQKRRATWCWFRRLWACDYVDKRVGPDYGSGNDRFVKWIRSRPD